MITTDPQVHNEPCSRVLLVLFDIDGTLLLSRRAGGRAMLAAARRLHGSEITTDGIEFAGRLDTQIWTAIAARNGIPDPDGRQREFRAAYAEILKELLASARMAYSLPGVPDLIAQLRREPQFILGLLTGNFPETGRLKIRAAGLDPSDFPVAAWADDGPARRDLPCVARQRYREITGRSIDPRHVVIVGDTPHDIDCAHTNGCLALAVATGPSYSLADLQACRPDLAVPDLSDTITILSWLRSQANGKVVT